MTDFNELKKLAQYCSTARTSGWQGKMGCDENQILELIAENERLKHEVSAGNAREWDLRSQVKAAKESRARVVESNKILRQDSERLKTAANFVQKLCYAAGSQPSVAAGYLQDILSVMSKEP